MNISFVKVKTDEQLDTLDALACEIWHECFPGIITVGQIDYMVEKFQSKPAMIKQMESGYVYHLVCEADKPLGYFAVEKQGQQLFLSKLYLHSSARGKGLASLSFEKICQIARKAGCSEIYLTVNRRNSHAIEVYKKWGFVITREQDADIGNGYVMDDYVMTYTL